MRPALVRLLVVVAALLVLPGSAWGREYFLCRMSGHVQAKCCCAKAHAAGEKPCPPGVRPGDCCERVRPGDGTQATNAAAATQTVQPAALTAIVPEPVYLPPLPPAREFAVRQGRGPPRPKGPLFAVHCSYLC